MSRPAVPVIMDGVRYPTIAAAAETAGLAVPSVIYALRHSGVTDGHTVAYAPAAPDGDQEKPPKHHEKRRSIALLGRHARLHRLGVYREQGV